MRKALEAALNPPPEPEIEVTPAMIEAGRKGFWDANHAGSSCDECYAESYRAMFRAQEGAAYAAKDARQGESASGSSWSHSRGGRIHQHRRKDDPK